MHPPPSSSPENPATPANPVGELLDIVTPTGLHVRTAGRREVHDGGHWHQVFHCLVVRSGQPARIVLQRRHRSKAAFPGLLDLSATGHLTAGERPEDGVRELNEELGTDASADDLTYAGVRLLVDDEGEGHNRERVHLYFMTDDRPLDRFAPEPTEVESLVEVGANDLLGLIGRLRDDSGVPLSHGPAVTSSIEAIEWRPGADPYTTTVEASDLIKPIDGYWTVLLVMADRFAGGVGPVAI